MGVIDIKADAERIWQTAQNGGVVIIPIDVAYTIMAQTPEGLKKTYDAKGRSYSKPCGSLCNLDIFDAVLDVDARAREAVHTLVDTYDLPVSVVGPFRRDHAFFAKVDPSCVDMSTKAGTMDMLLNAGRLHNELARLSWERKFPIMGSSANRSLAGSKFRLEDIEPEVLDAADLKIDYGLVKHHNKDAISSTIIDLSTFEVHRFGVCYELICDVLKRHFDIILPPKPKDRLVRGAALGDVAAE